MSGRRTAGQSGALAADSWYPPPESYWVAPPDDDARPLRYGDLFRAPARAGSGEPLVNSDGQPWHAVMALSPSCELVSKAKDTDLIEVARVLPLAAQEPKTAAAIAAGWQVRDGRVGVAFAHTIFLAGVPHRPSHAGGMFAHLRSTTRVRFADLRSAGRVGALDHDARVAVIRRELYYRYRWLVPMADVRANEAGRIRHDPYYTEPRPPWGQPGER